MIISYAKIKFICCLFTAHKVELLLDIFYSYSTDAKLPDASVVLFFCLVLI